MRLLSAFALVCAILGAGCAATGGEGQWNGAIDIPLTGPIILDRVVADSEWMGALRFESTFVIADGTTNDGTYPLELLVGSTEVALNVAVTVKNITRNVLVGTRTTIHDIITIYLTTPQGPLSVPSDYVLDANGWDYGSSMEEGYWNGNAWVSQPNLDPGKFNDGHPTGGRWARTGSDEPNRTLFWEFFIPRTSTLADVDGFQAGGTTALRMGIELQRQSPLNQSEEDNSRDFFPGDGPTPDGRLDPAGWLFLRIR